jgi:hypothetical protein
MIPPVNRLFRSLLVLVALVATVAQPMSARAAGEDWFGGRPPPPGAPPGTAQGVPPPLEPSPLLQDGPAPNDVVNDQNPEALTKFRPYLDPYGTWTDDPTYGRVWVPSASVVGPNFQPYVSNGRWALDESGEWIWVSDYSFGWVVFHYGRWVWIENTGWAWIPGNQYAPAWVVWRVPTGSYDYVGWAPAPPTFVWYAGVSFWWGYSPYYWWVFCPSPYLFHYHVGYYVATDPYWVNYAANNTRPYTAASPQPRSGNTSTSSPRPRSPSLRDARVPNEAVPSERVRAPAPSGSPSSRAPLNSPSTSASSSVRPSSRADAPTRSSLNDRSTRSMPSFRDSSRPSAGSHRLAPARLPSSRMGGARPDMRSAPRSVRPTRR